MEKKKVARWGLSPEENDTLDTLGFNTGPPLPTTSTALPTAPEAGPSQSALGSLMPIAMMLLGVPEVSSALGVSSGAASALGAVSNPVGAAAGAMGASPLVQSAVSGGLNARNLIGAQIGKGIGGAFSEFNRTPSSSPTPDTLNVGQGAGAQMLSQLQNELASTQKMLTSPTTGQIQTVKSSDTPSVGQLMLGAILGRISPAAGQAFFQGKAAQRQRANAAVPGTEEYWQNMTSRIEQLGKANAAAMEPARVQESINASKAGREASDFETHVIGPLRQQTMQSGLKLNEAQLKAADLDYSIKKNTLDKQNLAASFETGALNEKDPSKRLMLMSQAAAASGDYAGAAKLAAGASDPITFMRANSGWYQQKEYELAAAKDKREAIQAEAISAYYQGHNRDRLAQLVQQRVAMGQPDELAMASVLQQEKVLGGKLTPEGEKLLEDMTPEKAKAIDEFYKKLNTRPGSGAGGSGALGDPKEIVTYLEGLTKAAEAVQHVRNSGANKAVVGVAEAILQQYGAVLNDELRKRVENITNQAKLRAQADELGKRISEGASSKMAEIPGVGAPGAIGLQMALGSTRPDTATPIYSGNSPLERYAPNYAASEAEAKKSLSSRPVRQAEEDKTAKEISQLPLGAQIEYYRKHPEALGRFFGPTTPH